MDGVYMELTNMWGKSYPGVDLFATKVEWEPTSGLPEFDYSNL